MILNKRTMTFNLLDDFPLKAWWEGEKQTVSDRNKRKPSLANNKLDQLHVILDDKAQFKGEEDLIPLLYRRQRTLARYAANKVAIDDPKRQKWLSDFQKQIHEIRPGVKIKLPAYYEVHNVVTIGSGLTEYTSWKNGEQIPFITGIWKILAREQRVEYIEFRNEKKKLHCRQGPAILTREKAVWAIDGKEIGPVEWFRARHPRYPEESMFWDPDTNEIHLPVPIEQLDTWLSYNHVDEETRTWIKLEWG